MIHTARALMPTVYTLVPAIMTSEAATALLLAIGWQESRWRERRQIGGPARSFLQFEVGGVRGVLTHPASARSALQALTALQYRTRDPVAILMALEHNDVLALAFGRLLLWTLPWALPTAADPDAGWRQYLAAWRPGRPHPETWAEAWTLGHG